MPNPRPLRPHPFSTTRINNCDIFQSVDMWSIGVIIYILLGGYPPFMDENQTRLFRKIKAGNFKFHEEYWRHVSADAQVLKS